jgi:hypothetical protein
MSRAYLGAFAVERIFATQVPLDGHLRLIRPTDARAAVSETAGTIAWPPRIDFGE